MFSADCGRHCEARKPRVEQRGGRQRVGQLHRAAPNRQLDLLRQIVAHLRALGVGVAHAEQALRCTQGRIVDHKVCHAISVTPVCAGSQNGEANAYHKPAAAS